MIFLYFFKGLGPAGFRLSDECIQEARVREKPAALAEPKSLEFRPAEIRLKEIFNYG
ncbi:MAG: hypothetical protein M0Z79_04330 [Nitrospiraceae bacterium]|nr:hypothetical protein [Nitrospiraceae bacterium]